MEQPTPLDVRALGLRIRELRRQKNLSLQALSEHSGVSFSMLQGMGPWVLILGASAVSLALIGWLTKLTTLLPALAVGLVIGGALGNVIDRVRLGAVFDFLDFYLGNWHWPAFNLADSALTIGVALLVIDGLFEGRGRSKNPVTPEGQR